MYLNKPAGITYQERESAGLREKLYSLGLFKKDVERKNHLQYARRLS